MSTQTEPRGYFAYLAATRYLDLDIAYVAKTIVSTATRISELAEQEPLAGLIRAYCESLPRLGERCAETYNRRDLARVIR